MFYLTSKFHDNRVNAFGFMEGGGLLKPPPRPRNSKKIPGGIGLTKLLGYRNLLVAFKDKRDLILI